MPLTSIQIFFVQMYAYIGITGKNLYEMKHNVTNSLEQKLS